MIVSKYCSTKEIYEKVMSRTGQQYELNEDDSRLNIAEIVDLLGCPIQYVQKVIGFKQDDKYDFKNYTVPLPCDFYKLVPGGLAVDGNPVRWRANAFHYIKDGDCCDLENLNNQNIDIFIDNWGNEFSPQANSVIDLPIVYQDVTFDINDNEITFNIKKGKVCMAYYSYPLDNEGFLLIPDTAKYKRAVTNYLIWMNDYILWRTGSLPDKVYRESKEEAGWAIAAAASELKRPDVEQLESMKNVVTRLLPHFNSYNHFFKDNQQESRKLR